MVFQRGKNMVLICTHQSCVGADVTTVIPNFSNTKPCRDTVGATSPMLGFEDKVWRT